MAAEALKTTTQELAGSRVRVDVEVEAQAVERELRHAAGELAHDMKLPGFRKGKVPPEVVIQRAGREAVLDRALRRALPEWYEQAVAGAGLATVGEPKLTLGEPPPRGQPLEFSIEVGVRPHAKLGRYRGIEVGRHEPRAEPEEVDAELERLRESLAALETVERPARDRDFVVLDFAGRVDGEPFEGGEARGYVLELGSGQLIEGFEPKLAGAAAGEEREIELTLPGDFQLEELRGKPASFATTVREVKEKRLPELDDDFAVDAGGFDSLAELRADVERQVLEAKQAAAEREFREAAADAAAAEAKLELPAELVEAKAREMWHMTAAALARRGMDPEQYLRISGKSEDEIVREAMPDAERALRRESVLAAIVEAEGIEVTEEDELEALRRAAEAQGVGGSDGQLRRSLERARARGQAGALREDIAMRKAVDLLVEHAKPIPVERAKARERLWAPGKEGEAAAGERSGLWTPGS